MLSFLSLLQCLWLFFSMHLAWILGKVVSDLESRESFATLLLIHSRSGRVAGLPFFLFKYSATLFIARLFHKSCMSLTVIGNCLRDSTHRIFMKSNLSLIDNIPCKYEDAFSRISSIQIHNAHQTPMLNMHQQDVIILNQKRSK